MNEADDDDDRVIGKNDQNRDVTIRQALDSTSDNSTMKFLKKKAQRFKDTGDTSVFTRGSGDKPKGKAIGGSDSDDKGDKPKGDDGGEKPEEPKGGKLGGGDFDRGGGDSSSAGPDPDMKGDPSETEQAIASAEKLADKYGIESDVAGNEQGLNRVNIGAGGEYEGDNSITVNYDDGKYGVGIQGEDAMQGPIGYMSFDSKKEMESALDKILGNKKIKNALKKGDSLEGMKDEIESLGKGGSDAGAKVDGPSPEDDWDTGQVMTAKLDGEEVGDIIGDEGHPKYKEALKYIMSFDPDDERLYTGSGEKEESITINGQKYKPIKESKKHPLKEIYDRTFRSLK